MWTWRFSGSLLGLIIIRVSVRSWLGNRLVFHLVWFQVSMRDKLIWLFELYRFACLIVSLLNFRYMYVITSCKSIDITMLWIVFGEIDNSIFGKETGSWNCYIPCQPDSAGALLIYSVENWSRRVVLLCGILSWNFERVIKIEIERVTGSLTNNFLLIFDVGNDLKMHHLIVYRISWIYDWTAFHIRCKK